MRGNATLTIVGTGFDALVSRSAAAVPVSHAASFSGVLATVNQLAIVTGIAVAGTLYLSRVPVTGLEPMPRVLAGLAVALAVTGGLVASRERDQLKPGEWTA